MNEKTIHPYNEDNNPHGYWEMYHITGELAYKCYYNDGEEEGYEEFYAIDSLLTKDFHLI